ncbi:MAG TPA: hypothetical protein PK052_00875 [Anaerohalosphaeraceae bacterium]|nr:hypothetical protein [Anaerohalosphaeraceae bacterium]HPC63955.1 hypothetical protein [Anaerohalosphaeraceae bacterium]HPO69304.1 hypothetical protein [Anaerohalosphaeraceae bacterium]HRS70384.1 hypothetical protein [Anaerohalosphaeraceae bacterium]HRV20259.1 hypothetical protein [Anaerohalosphaeraceae bacterium]
MFRWICLFGFAAAAAALALHHLVFPCGYNPRFAVRSVVRKLVHLLTLLFLPQTMGWAGRICKLAFLLGLLCFAVLALTGFGPLLCGGRLEGWLLMIHMTAAPVFAVCAAVVVLLAAGRYAFNRADAPAILACAGAGSGRCWLTDSGIGVKIGFWFLAAAGLPLILAPVLSMLPWVGTDGQTFLAKVHQWCALVFSLAAITQLYMLIRMEVLRDMKAESQSL